MRSSWVGGCLKTPLKDRPIVCAHKPCVHVCCLCALVCARVLCGCPCACVYCAGAQVRARNERVHGYVCVSTCTLAGVSAGHPCCGSGTGGAAKRRRKKKKEKEKGKKGRRSHESKAITTSKIAVNLPEFTGKDFALLHCSADQFCTTPGGFCLCFGHLYIWVSSQGAGGGGGGVNGKCIWGVGVPQRNHVCSIGCAG